MNRMRSLLTTCVFVLGAAIAGGQSSAAALFQQGLMLERAEGNVQQAIVLFERVVAEFPNDATIVPQAMLHLAQVYEKQNDPRALRMWSRLAAEYSSSPYAAEAKRKVAANQSQSSGPFRTRSVQGVFGEFSWRNVTAPDARSIAWAPAEQSGDLMLRSVDTGKDRVLARLAGRRIFTLIWAGDSSRIAVVTRAADGKSTATGPHDIRLVTVQTGQVKTVLSSEAGDTVPYWSPDSRTLLLHAGKQASEKSTDLRIIDATTGDSRKVALSAPLVGEVSWSHDSKQVAFRTVTAPNQDELWILTLASGQVHTLKTSLTSANGRINVATGVTTRWTPDGRILVRQQTTSANGSGAGNAFLFVSSTTGQAAPNCANSPQLQCKPFMTPAGTRLASDPTTGRLLLIDPGTAASRRVTMAAAEETGLAFSPDGRLLMFTSNPDGAPALYVAPVDHAPIAAPLRIAAFEPSVSPIIFAWSADGRAVVDFYQEETDIFRVNMDRNGRSTGAPLRLTQDTRNNFRPAVAPDGRTVAYQYDRGIAVMTADGASERPVVQVQSRGRIEWRSADELIFQRGGPSPTASMASLNVKTGVIQSLVDLPAIQDRWQFNAARNEIVYLPIAVNGASTIRAKSLSDGSDRELITLESKLALSISFRLSPDGRFIAWDRLVGTQDRRVHEMHVMTIDGKEDRLLKIDAEPTGDWRGAGPYSWSPDSRFVVFDGRPGKLMVADVNSGESWPVAGAADTDTVTWNHATWSPDGSFVLLSRNGWRDDFRLIEGLTYDAVMKLMGKR